MNPNTNVYIQEFLKTLEIPKSLDAAASTLLKDGRDFWRWYSILYDEAPAKVKRKLTWIAKRYEKAQGSPTQK